MHAALEVARGIDDPEALVAVMLPDGGRAYLSKIFNDAWMDPVRLPRAHGRARRRRRAAREDAAGEIPPLVVVQTDQKVRDAIALLHEHRVSQLPVVSTATERAIVGSVGERGLLKRAIGDPR